LISLLLALYKELIVLSLVCVRENNSRGIKSAQCKKEVLYHPSKRSSLMELEFSWTWILMQFWLLVWQGPSWHRNKEGHNFCHLLNCHGCVCNLGCDIHHRELFDSKAFMIVNELHSFLLPWSWWLLEKLLFSWVKYVMYVSPGFIHVLTEMGHWITCPNFKTFFSYHYLLDSVFMPNCRCLSWISLKMMLSDNFGASNEFLVVHNLSFVILLPFVTSSNLTTRFDRRGVYWENYRYMRIQYLMAVCNYHLLLIMVVFDL